MCRVAATRERSDFSQLQGCGCWGESALLPSLSSVAAVAGERPPSFPAPGLPQRGREGTSIVLERRMVDVVCLRKAKGSFRNDGLKAADVLPILKEKVAFVSGVGAAMEAPRTAPTPSTGSATPIGCGQWELQGQCLWAGQGMEPEGHAGLPGSGLGPCCYLSLVRGIDGKIQKLWDMKASTQEVGLPAAACKGSKRRGCHHKPFPVGG
ncbi:Kalirin [Chelonia mydas]|uniref:Kalirin n=1 Tax=Chelonia mydas TaxID=8469 RepID=M7BKG0_CHEMY|nr:Kalirin [Chelonia mydas]